MGCGWCVCYGLPFPLGGCVLGLRVCGNGPIGCTNNNYASREKCKKCGQPKEVAAMPATAMPGASLPTHSNYFARTQGVVAVQRVNNSLFADGSQQPLPPGTSWPMGGSDNCVIQQTSYGKYEIGSNQTNQSLMGAKGWRNGDWICSCGFHNYASRAECKKCNASMPPALGTKRLASEEINQWDNKRLNAGPAFGLQHAYPSFDQTAVAGGKPTTGVFHPSLYASGSSSMVPNLPTNLQFSLAAATPTLLGKGAKQWRDGDWMCQNCDNHNYASRSQCNRCKTQKDETAQPVSVS